MIISVSPFPFLLIFLSLLINLIEMSKIKN
ncbi:hypothetical protein PFFCH_01413 [Plasmodium falciparum FCH/4]|uniref:Uncharacterized protein n=1 Tax=Plasmodium falciparum FCH/4 TaxID=1036724 RepID=A0A024VSG0_PLAFA|nr:hypothetical protein PFFCH_01413 [Plasmodium falciparum FCH/4]